MEPVVSCAGLAKLSDFWDYWGFEPWSRPPFEGVRRLQRFVKSGLLGTVAEFHALDHIVWTDAGAEELTQLWNDSKPLPDIMTQRYLFLREDAWPERRLRSFSFGFLGYLEFYAYWPGLESHVKAKDLSGLVDLGLDLLQKAG
jgi:hypothetical protein